MNITPAPTRSERANVVPLRVVRNDGVSRDTVACLRHLLARAERGEIIGVSFAAMQADREFFLSNCGEAHRNPAFASALAGSLWYQNMKQVFGDA